MPKVTHDFCLVGGRGWVRGVVWRGVGGGWAGGYSFQLAAHGGDGKIFVRLYHRNRGSLKRMFARKGIVPRIMCSLACLEALVLILQN